jgi:hypothetical protein
VSDYQRIESAQLDGYAVSGTSPPVGGQPEPLMTARQVADYLQTTPRRIMEWWKTGQLRGFWLNPSGRRDLRFRLSDVEAFLEARSFPVYQLAAG